MSLLAELKRRNVFRVAMLYGVASWVLLQVGDLLFGVLGVPPWGIKLLLGLLVLGFPLALIFSWVYELTPEGVRREQEIAAGTSIATQTGRKLNLLIAALLAVAIGLLATDRLRSHGPVATSTASAPVAAHVAAPSAEPAEPSIAVLPFVNMSDDKENEYFADGLTEELLNTLANVPGLRVIARTSSFAYKGREVRVSDIAHDLKVDHVLEGSVRKAGNRVRITAQLIRTSDSSHMWSETYDRDLKDIFAIQDEISGKVASALKGQLLQSPPATQEIGGTRVPEAYEAFLRGSSIWINQGDSESGLKAALAGFDEAIRLDPGFARAYALRAGVLNRMVASGYLPVQPTFEQARQAARKAIELAPDLAEAYLPLTYVLQVFDNDLHAAAAAAKRALQLNPGDFNVQSFYSMFASSLGQTQLAIAAADKAVSRDPVSPWAYYSRAFVLLYARKPVQAEADARRALALAPGLTDLPSMLGMALLAQNRTDEALAAFDRETVESRRVSGRALAFARSGKPELARTEMAALQKKLGDAGSYQYAQIEAQLGDRDAAFRWLATARRVHDPGLMYNVYVDPLLDPIRQDPRYDALIRELGFPPKP